MKKLATLTAFVLTTATASAHPGHPGHEDWPFDDFKMVALAGVAAIILATIALKLRPQKG